ncbi:MAG: hypothetical protein SynsKO_05120 [Synoicihabitans sp.]
MADAWAFFIFEAATNSIALVIWRVFLTDLMRRRMSRVEAMWIYNLGFTISDLVSASWLIRHAQIVILK